MDNLECANCCKQLRTRSGMIRHLKKCHGKRCDDFTTRECSNCCKQLRTRSGMVRHLKKCDGKRFNDFTTKRYPCNHCRREFFSASGLFRHERKKHDVSSQKVKSLKCLYCPATFASKYGRALHAKKYHLQYSTKLNDLNTRKLFECIFCLKSFTRKSYRKQHEDKCNQIEGTVTVHEGLVHIDNLPNEASASASATANITPKLQCYTRDRKSFQKLVTADVDTPRRSRLNLEYGQQTEEKFQNRINALEEKVRRLQNQVKTYKDQILYLEERNKISASTADTLLVYVEKVKPTKRRRV